MLSFGDSVFPSDPIALVLGTVFKDVPDLVIQRLLDAEDIRCLVLQHPRGSRLAVFPGIVSVFGAAKTDVIGHDLDLDGPFFPGLNACRKQHGCREEREDKLEMSFHNMVPEYDSGSQR